ncbi:hypothetical protein W97_08419 [Coniosporium apollinis CBS 100218]|uniref:Phytocyanin domain-containing protein n=1 Tax=Coniosporium apollinis (strain CBS 100218) TaxID=1168221 RepID=R7Z5G7_CONA1|nr:uncharacterized protein W97_08419 [Coniosporium apollinis CBS 100218]EON69259.1 hypothetical protein W97_08419 [Coniosporium apollinis CBS 100218]
MFPCIPYENTGRGKVGFFSGFRPVDAFLNDPPTWNLRINNTDPIFYYCSAPGSCNNYAMIGVINPNKSVSLETQKSLALQAAYVMNPGDPFPPEASSSIASLTTSPTSTSTLPSSTAATASTTPTPAPAEEEEDDDLSTGAIVGIALGGAAILLLAAALFYYFFSRSRTLKQPFASPPLSSATRHGPDMYQSGGTVFVPVLPKDYRSSALSQQPYDVPPYSEEPLRSASPRSDVGDMRSYTSTPAPSLSPRSPYSPHSPHSPQEMYAPFPHPKPAQQTV